MLSLTLFRELDLVVHHGRKPRQWKTCVWPCFTEDLTGVKVSPVITMDGKKRIVLREMLGKEVEEARFSIRKEPCLEELQAGPHLVIISAIPREPRDL